MISAKKKTKKTATKKISWWKDKAWALMSEYIRRKHCDSEGYGNCYTCNVNMHWKQLQAGHAIGGRHGKVLFDEEIIRLQCVYCNVYKRGNYGIFAVRLDAENGVGWYEMKEKASHGEMKRSRKDYEALIEGLQLKLAVYEYS